MKCFQCMYMTINYTCFYQIRNVEKMLIFCTFLRALPCCYSFILNPADKLERSYNTKYKTYSYEHTAMSINYNDYDVGTKLPDDIYRRLVFSLPLRSYMTELARSASK